MRSRLYSVAALLFIIWMVIGVGYTLTFTELSTGEVKQALVEVKKTRQISPLPASLMGSQSEATFSSLIFVGDVLLARNVEYLMRTNGYGYPYVGLSLTSLATAPAVIGNFEAAIPIEHKPTPIGMIDFSVAMPLAKSLSEYGFTHMSLGNNHSHDFEAPGFNNTRDVLGQNLTAFGHPNEIIDISVSTIEVGDNTIGLLGINQLERIQNQQLEQVMRNLIIDSDFQIIYIHWGEEYALRHNDSQTKFAEQLIELGADLIVGHHPHVVQGVDLIDDVPVFYSLGNYIFDQYFSKEVQEGLVLVMNLDEKINISLIPVSSRKTISQPTLMGVREHAIFLQTLANKSDNELKEMILRGQITIGEEVASLDKVAIMHHTNKYVQ